MRSQLVAWDNYRLSMTKMGMIGTNSKNKDKHTTIDVTRKM